MLASLAGSGPFEVNTIVTLGQWFYLEACRCANEPSQPVSGSSCTKVTQEMFCHMPGARDQMPYLKKDNKAGKEAVLLKPELSVNISEVPPKPSK